MQGRRGRWRSGERSPLADRAVRAVGGLLLGLCAAAVWWLRRWVEGLPAHRIDAVELVAALLAVLCWAAGWAAVAQGRALFRPLPGAGRDAVSPLPMEDLSDERSPVARRRRRAVPDDAGVCPVVRRGMRSAR